MRTFSKHALTGALVLALLAGPALGMGSDSPAAKQDPNYVRAKELVAAGDYAAAVPLLRQAVAADPKNADAFNFLGYSNRNLGDRQSALTYYMEALALAPEHRGANEYLGELYLEMGEIEKARERLGVLDSACFFGCPEYRELKTAIEAYQASAGS